MAQNSESTHAGEANTIHFVGIAGTGMRALSQLAVARGYIVTGSDRSFDQGQQQELRRLFEKGGIEIFPQDGSGVGETTAAVVVSGAVEETIQDVADAKAKNVPIFARSEFLSSLAEEYHTSIAVAGTSGKTTVVAMLGHILAQAGMDPTVVNGGATLDQPEDAGIGSARIGAGDVIIYEADESDGSLVRYHPTVSVITNLARDHFEEQEVLQMFAGLVGQTKGAVVAGIEVAEKLQAMKIENAPEFVRYSVYSGPDRAFPVAVKETGWGIKFGLDSADFELTIPGEHNMLNAVAAVLAAKQLGVAPQISAQALTSFAGVRRRLELLGEVNRIRVVDDYSHNPAKIEAALRTLRPRSRFLHVVFQLHGFAPAKFMREQLVEVFARNLGKTERVILPEIYYAGGSASKDISAKDIVEDLKARGVNAQYSEGLFEVQEDLLHSVNPGDIILVMGARNPDLPVFAEGIVQAIARMA
jgi:UDP-N-acetylmuramate--L-alanine ligase